MALFRYHPSKGRALYEHHHEEIKIYVGPCRDSTAFFFKIH